MQHEANVTKLRQRLRALGYDPLPLYGKKPAFENWPNKIKATHEEIAAWPLDYRRAENTGLIGKRSPWFDIDILNNEAASEIEHLVRTKFGEHGFIAVRFGRPPKRAVPFRCDQPFPSFKIKLIAPNGASGEQRLEFLADGAQAVAFGVHPDTCRPYAWFGTALDQVKRSDLPLITEAEARALMNDAVDILVNQYGYQRATSEPNGFHQSAGTPWGDLIIDTLQKDHDSETRLAMNLIRARMNAGAVINLLSDLLHKTETEKDARWQRRLKEIPGIVTSAVKKCSTAPAIRKPRLQLIAFDDIQLNAEPEYLIDGIIPRIGMTVVWGRFKSGKSFWIFDATMHIALGWEYRGRRVQQGPVIYCALEGQTGFAKRKAAFEQRHLAEDHQPVPFYLQPTTMDLVGDHSELIAVIRSTLGEFVPAVLVLDTLNRSLAGSESSDEDMASYIQAADAVREAFACAVIIVHHCGHDGTRPRGHTSLTGAVDAQLSVERDANGHIITTVEWMKDGGSEGDKIISALEVVEVGTNQDARPITSCIVVSAGAGMHGAPTTTKLSDNTKLALDALYEAIADHGEVVASTRIPAHTRTVPVVRWFENFEAKMAPSAIKPDSVRTAFARALQKLQVLKIVGIWKETAWVVGHAGQARTSI